MNPAELESALRAGGARLGLELTAAQIALLIDYLGLLQKWGKVYNLTAVRDRADMLTHHLLDSMAVLTPLRRHAGSVGLPAMRVLDVGSGAGLPGVVIAICCPEMVVSCVDTVAKKAAFIQQVAVSLRLANLNGIHARVERLTTPFDVVTSRAFASLADFVGWSEGALCPQQGVWMAMKGRHPADELSVLPSTVEVFHVEQLQVPGLDAERCLVWMRPRKLPA